MVSSFRNTTQYKIAGTDTFRLASSGLVTGQGTNLQNIDKDLRAIYHADEGKVLIQVDQSGAEALIVAYLCEAGKFRDLFLHNVKPHVFVALHLFKDIWMKQLPTITTLALSADIATLQHLEGWKELDGLIKSSDNWPAASRYYYIAKMICHASNYGMKGAAFQMNVMEKSKGTIVLTKREADDYLGNYHSLFPEIHKWHWELEQQVRKTRKLYNLQGFPREVCGEINASTIKSLFAFIPQSTVGTITNIALTNLQRYIELTDIDWDILGNCHDSYLCQAPENEVNDCATQMKSFIEQELTNLRGEKFRMKSEVQIGSNWKFK